MSSIGKFDPSDGLHRSSSSIGSAMSASRKGAASDSSRAIAAEVALLQECSAETFKANESRVLQLARKDPLYTLSPEENSLLWTSRKFLMTVPELLPLFLQCVRWDVALCAAEARRLMMYWEPPSPLLALQLLDSKFVDPSVRGCLGCHLIPPPPTHTHSHSALHPTLPAALRPQCRCPSCRGCGQSHAHCAWCVRGRVPLLCSQVRAFAVSCLEGLNNEQLRQYLLQLTQVLKFEPFNDSSLARYLIRRAVRNPAGVGHMFYWYLQAEMHLPEVSGSTINGRRLPGRKCPALVWGGHPAPAHPGPVAALASGDGALRCHAGAVPS
jgi:hypothetical protein